jgi:Flp pilus assembly CpaE family ATPase
MECWVIGDNQDLSERIRKALQHLNQRCPETHLISLADADRTPQMSETVNGIAFIALPTVGHDDIEIIRSIRKVSQLRMVLVSSGADNASIVNAIRAGVSDYLDKDQDLVSEVSCCLSRIKRAESEQKPKSFTISIVPCHVASDSSILATNLAAVIAQKQGSCCLLDFQLRGGDLALLLKLQPLHSIYDLISQPQSVDEGMFQQALAPHESGLHLLAGPQLFSDLRGIDPSSCKDIVGHAQGLFPYVVIATEDIQHSEQIHALSHSDQVVLTMRPDLLSLHRAKQHIDFMLAHDINNDRVQVAVMGVGLGGELPIVAIKKVLNNTAVHAVPDDATALTLSINVGNPVVLESPKSRASQGILKLASSLVGNDSEVLLSKPEGMLGAKAAVLLALNTLSFCK